jgi:NAD(P)-dependent dehydrogenase (short-subunit alcohol dehydrogenase family)
MKYDHNKSLLGRVAIVTGGASGIGRQICIEFAQRGAFVLVTDIDGVGASRVNELIRTQGGDASAEALDVAAPGRLEAIIRETAGRYGRLDYVVNNAGIGIVGEVRDVSEKDVRRIVEVNLMGLVRGCAAAYEVMREQGQGHIVNMASMAGLVGFQTMAHYAMTKAAVLTYSQALRVEAAAFGVKVTTVCPAFVDSKIYENAIAVGISNDKLRELLPFKPLSTERAVEYIMRGIVKNEDLVLFPAYARVLWWLARLAPKSSVLIGQFTLMQLRGARTSPAIEPLVSGEQLAAQ